VPSFKISMQHQVSAFRCCTKNWGTEVPAGLDFFFLDAAFNCLTSGDRLFAVEEEFFLGLLLGKVTGLLEVGDLLFFEVIFLDPRRFCFVGMGKVY
jgi:hypothetical protein